jgi:hypothetical protein
MSPQQMEHALKVMYDEIKSLKKQVSDLEKALDTICKYEHTHSNRDYWNVDNHMNR